MKKILTLAIAVLATTGLTMSAASLKTNTNQDNKEKKEQVEKKDRQGGKKMGKKDHKFNPFEGINLTEEQKTQLKEIFPCKGERKAPKEAPCCKSGTAACCQGQGQACCWELTPEQAKQAAAERLSKIKAILTPEQYQQYLENTALKSLMPKKHDKKSKDGRGGEGDKQRKGLDRKHAPAQADK